MKKAKIMLVALAIVGIAAGASAFTAKHTFGTTIYEATGPNVQPTITHEDYTLTFNSDPAPISGYFVTSPTATTSLTSLAYTND